MLKREKTQEEPEQPEQPEEPEEPKDEPEQNEPDAEEKSEEPEQQEESLLNDIDVLSADSIADLAPDQEKMALKGKDVYQAWYVINCSAYKHYMDHYESPYRSVIRQRRNSFYYQSHLVAWRVLTFNMSSESKYADKEFGYYEAYLYNLLLDENAESLVGNLASSMESASSAWKTNSEQLGASAWSPAATSTASLYAARMWRSPTWPACIPL